MILYSHAHLACVHGSIKHRTRLQKGRSIPGLGHIDVSSPQIDTRSSINLAVNINGCSLIQGPAIVINSLRCLVSRTKGVAGGKHGQSAGVNHTSGAHNHTLVAQEVQLATNFIIANSVDRTINADAVLHRIHQGVQHSVAIFLLEVQIRNLVIAHRKMVEGIETNARSCSLLCINMRRATGNHVFGLACADNIASSKVNRVRSKGAPSQPRRHGKAHAHGQYGAQHLHAQISAFFSFIF